MATGSNPGVDHEVHIGHDDYSLSRVPESERYSWITVAVQRFGQLSALSQFLLGATLGFGMSFWNAFLALTLGAVILEVVAVFVGIAGMREGLSTSVLSRWTGFGRYGCAQESGRHKDRDLHERLPRHDHPRRSNAQDQRLEPLLFFPRVRQLPRHPPG